MNRLRASLQGIVLALTVFGLYAEDTQAQSMSPPPGKALIVLYRSDKQPVAGKVPIVANADRLGALGNGEFVKAVVNPGRSFLRAGDTILTTLAIQTTANKTSYVLVQAVPGGPLRVEMRETNEELARQPLSQSRAASTAVAAAAAAAAPRPPASAAAVPLAAAPAAAAQAPAQRPPAAAPPPPQRQAAAPPAKPAPPPPANASAREPSEDERPDWSYAVIAKTGSFKLASPNQTVGGLAGTYSKSKPVASVEAEMRHLEGVAWGVELLYYKNDFTPDGTSLKGEQTVISTYFNGKYYFEATSWLYPFVGAGLGYAGASFGGDYTGKVGGFAYQAMAGTDIRLTDTFGLYLEYKYLRATGQDSTGQTIKLGGSGILAGLSIAF